MLCEKEAAQHRHRVPGGLFTVKRLLITGDSGFVAKHLITACKDDYIVYGISRTSPDRQVDMQNFEELRRAILSIGPDHIIHLASQSSVERSWEYPSDSFTNNTCIFLNLIDSIRSIGINPRILSIGSSEQYGLVSPSNLPIQETCPLNPNSPYAIARVAQEQLAILFSQRYGMDIVCTRSFNHCGVGQSERFVIPSIVNQFKYKENPQAILVGNKSVVRDFIDVRDVIEAYKLLLRHGKSGEVYNVCSGRGRSIEVIVKMVSEIYSVDVDIVEDKSKSRPVDNPIIVGSNDKIKSELGWCQKIPFEQSLKDVCGVKE